MSDVLSRPGLRLVKPGEEWRYPKASLWLRAGARAVDLAIAWFAWAYTGPAGVVMALLYLLLADGMLQGQSPGKRLFGVRAVFLPTRQPARHRDSVLRNAPFGLVVILSMMPELGPRAFVAGAVVVGGVEALRTWRDKDGRRLGDDWAQTQVVDAKVVLGQAELAGPVDEGAHANARLKQGTRFG